VLNFKLPGGLLSEKIWITLLISSLALQTVLLRALCEIAALRFFFSFRFFRIKGAHVVHPGRESFRSLQDRFSGRQADILQHPLENPLMEQVKGIPVQDSEQPLGRNLDSC
jgi:hypothetical protein